MASRSYREDREDDGWIRPYNPYRDVSDWDVRPHAQRGQENYGFDREQDFHNDPYYNRPYYISSNGMDRDRRPRRIDPRDSRHVPIPRSKQTSFICWALAMFSILALLLLGALTIFLVLYALDIQRNNSTQVVTPSQQPAMTTQAPATGFVKVNVAMRMMQTYLPAYNDALSPEYMALENSFTNSMDNIFLSSTLRNSYEATVVNSFSPGSVDVDATVLSSQALIALITSLNQGSGESINSLIREAVLEIIMAATQDGACCQGLGIDSTSVQVIEVEIGTLPTTSQSGIATTAAPDVATTAAPDVATTAAPDIATTAAPDVATTAAPDIATTAAPDVATTAAPDIATTAAPDVATTAAPDVATTAAPDVATTAAPDIATTAAPDIATTAAPDVATTAAPDVATTAAPGGATTAVPAATTAAPEVATTTVAPDVATTAAPDVATTAAPDVATTTVLNPVTTPTVSSDSTPQIGTTTAVPGTTAGATTTEGACETRRDILDSADCGMTATQAPPSNAFQADVGTWPWVGSVQLTTGLACGVTLINNEWAVTSASCLSGVGTLSSLVFGDITNSNSQSDDSVEVAVERVHFHPGYNPLTFDNNIAFLKLAEAVEYSESVGPVCGDDGSQAYSNCYVAGWSTLSGSLNDSLWSAPVASISEGSCSESSPVMQVLTDKFLCAEFTEANACLGDSGGGLMCQNTTTGAWRLVGITDINSADCRSTSFVKFSLYWDAATSIVSCEDFEIPCDPIEVPQCTASLPYPSTYPTSQSALAILLSNLQADCHEDFMSVVCATFLPECLANGTRLTVCQQTCEAVTSSCSTRLSELQLDFDCRLYPLGYPTSSGLCDSGEDFSCGNRSLILSDPSDYLTISSPNHPNAYPGFDDCVWIITAPQGSQVALKFLELSTEACCDSVTIGEGTDITDRTSIHDLVSGNILPPVMIIPSSVVWLRFLSDDSEHGNGFVVEALAVGNTGLGSLCSEPNTYRCTDGVTCIPFRWRCDGIADCVLRDDESCQVIYQEITLSIDGYQQLVSPGYPSAGYQVNSRHTYIITTVPGNKLLINFDGFSSEEDYDILYVGDGADPKESSSLFFLWSGDTVPPTILSDANQMWIQFTSDVVINDLGYDLFVFDVPGSVTFDCDETQFDCGHTVCVSIDWQCDGKAQCLDGSDETGCVGIMASGLITLLSPFSVGLGDPTSSEYLSLSQQVTEAMDAVVNDNIGSGYVYLETIINSFRSSDDPTERAAVTAHTVVDFTIHLTDLPVANPTNVTEQILLGILLDEISDGRLGNVNVNSSSLELYEVLDDIPLPTTPAPPTPCNDDEFECHEGTCIAQSLVCDQLFDCPDSSDEELGSHCPIACGSDTITVPVQGSVTLTAPAVLPNLPATTFQSCMYLVTAPANHRIYVVVHSVNLNNGYQSLVLNFGEGSRIVFTSNVEQPTALISVTNMLQVILSGYFWIEESGIDMEFWIANDTDIATCDNNVQVLPAEKKCNQAFDCHDYSDEINCIDQCGQANYTLDYNLTVSLQLTDYPSTYGNNTACLWLITGPPNTTLLFQTDVIDLGRGDSLTFGQGHVPYAPMTTVAVMPGGLSTGALILVEGSQAYVIFLSDSMAAGTGFQIGMRAANEEDYFRCDNLIQAVPQENVCDGVAQCHGDPTDETNCDLCLSIPLANCSALLPYSTTAYPNSLATDSSDALAQYQLAAAYFCQVQSELVLCSLLFPECPSAQSRPRAICRSVCEEAVRNCSFREGICDSLPETGEEVWCTYNEDVLKTGICGTVPLSPNPAARIVNGEDAAMGEWPWMLAVLDSDYVFRCGASLISPQWAITAAHCADIIDSVLVGINDMSNLGSNYQLVSVSEVHTHELYGHGDSQQHDIALMKLARPLEFNDYIRPVCLNTEQNETEIYTNCYATGWGALSEGGSTAQQLQEVRLPLVTLENCSKSLEDAFIINEFMICAGYEAGGRDSCQGDSGGPLVCETSQGRWVLVGATSFGLGCARPGRPGVYARISQYIDFIEYHVNRVPLPPEPVVAE